MTQDTDNHGMYVVEHGDYAGIYFIVIDKKDNNYECLALPRQSRLSIPVDAFDRGKKNLIIDRVADIPDDIYNYCKHIYNEIQDNTNEKENNYS